MSNIEVKNVEGKKVSTLDLNSDVFGITPNVTAMHEVVRAQRASWRQGTAETRTRGQVRGGGRKPWRQKGTGRARQGSIRAPQWKGGGTVWGPHQRSYAIKVPKKVIKLAMRSALSDKASTDALVVVDQFTFDKPSTKQAKAALESLGVEGRCTVIVDNDNFNAMLSFRNLPKVLCIPVSEMNTYDFINNKKLVLTSGAVKRIEEVLA